MLPHAWQIVRDNKCYCCWFTDKLWVTEHFGGSCPDPCYLPAVGGYCAASVTSVETWEMLFLQCPLPGSMLTMHLLSVSLATSAGLQEGRWWGGCSSSSQCPFWSPALDAGRADFRLLRERVSKVPWENASEGAGIHQCWSPPPKGTGAGKSKMLKVKQTRQKAFLDDQGSSGANTNKKRCLSNGSKVR